MNLSPLILFCALCLFRPCFASDAFFTKNPSAISSNLSPLAMPLEFKSRVHGAICPWDINFYDLRPEHMIIVLQAENKEEICFNRLYSLTPLHIDFSINQKQLFPHTHISINKHFIFIANTKTDIYCLIKCSRQQPIEMTHIDMKKKLSSFKTKFMRNFLDINKNGRFRFVEYLDNHGKYQVAVVMVLSATKLKNTSLVRMIYPEVAILGYTNHEFLVKFITKNVKSKLVKKKLWGEEFKKSDISSNTLQLYSPHWITDLRQVMLYQNNFARLIHFRWIDNLDFDTQSLLLVAIWSVIFDYCKDESVEKQEIAFDIPQVYHVHYHKPQGKDFKMDYTQYLDGWRCAVYEYPRRSTHDYYQRATFCFQAIQDHNITTSSSINTSDNLFPKFTTFDFDIEDLVILVDRGRFLHANKDQKTLTLYDCKNITHLHSIPWLSYENFRYKTYNNVTRTEDTSLLELYTNTGREVVTITFDNKLSSVLKLKNREIKGYSSLDFSKQRLTVNNFQGQTIDIDIKVKDKNNNSNEFMRGYLFYTHKFSQHHDLEDKYTSSNNLTESTDDQKQVDLAGHADAKEQKLSEKTEGRDKVSEIDEKVKLAPAPSTSDASFILWVSENLKVFRTPEVSVLTRKHFDDSEVVADLTQIEPLLGQKFSAKNSVKELKIYRSSERTAHITIIYAKKKYDYEEEWIENCTEFVEFIIQLY